MTKSYSDATLVAFLDGELNAEETKEIEEAIETNSELQQRIESLGSDLDPADLKAAFDGLLEQAPAYRAPQSASPKKETSKFGRSAAWTVITAGSVAASLFIGLFLGQSQGDRVETWKEYAAAYHVLYRENTLLDIEVDDDKSLALASQFGVELNDLTSVADEFKLVRVQNLGFKNKPILHVAYLAKNGQPMALCLMPNSAGASEVEEKDLYKIATASWRDEKFDYVVLGGADQAQVARFTTAVRANL